MGQREGEAGGQIEGGIGAWGWVNKAELEALQSQLSIENLTKRNVLHNR